MSPILKIRKRLKMDLGVPLAIAMSSLINDLRFALRTMRRNPGFSCVAILALGLGIGANTAVFTIVNGVLLKPLPFHDAGSLFLVSNTPKDMPFGPEMGLTEADYLRFRQQDRVFQNVAAIESGNVSLSGAGDPALIGSARVTADFLAVLEVQPILGRGFAAGDEHAGANRVALLSDRTWRHRFHADPAAIGKVIRLDGVDYTVIGVMPAGFRFPNGAEVWTPLEIRVNPRISMLRTVVARLKPGRSRREAQAELQAFARGKDGPSTDTLPQILPLNDLLAGEVREPLLIFSGAIAFVLLIACANVANLLLMRAASRQQEVSVRVALGAGRWRLVRQLLTESSLVSLGGGAAGILLAMWGVPALLALAPPGEIPRTEDVRIDGAVLAFTFGLSLLTGLVFGAIPAIRVSGRDSRESLSRGARASLGQYGTLRNALAAAEIAMALILLSGAGLLVKSFLKVRAVDPGFRSENVMTMAVHLPSAVYRNATEMQAFDGRLLDKLAALPGVSASGAVSSLPMGSGNLFAGDFQIQNRRLPEGYMADKLVVSPGYFRALGIRMQLGRDFSGHDSAGSPGAVVVSQSLARTFWPGESPIGKQLSEEDHPKPKDWLTIVGVVDDVRQEELKTKPGPAIYYSYLQTPRTEWLPTMVFVVRSAGTWNTASAMRAALKEVDPNQAAEAVTSMQTVLEHDISEPLFQARLLTAFSAIALMLAAIGVYGVMAYSVALRSREIGIRMALGAKAGDVMGLVLRRTMWVAGAGLLLGTAGSVAATRVLKKFLFEVAPTDIGTLFTGGCLLGLVALAAGWLPARRATRVDPLVVLRYE